MFKASIVASALVALAPIALAQDHAAPDLSEMPCKAIMAAHGSKFYLDVELAVMDRFNALGEGDHFGSTCNMGDYVLAVCKRSPGLSLKRAVQSLVDRRKAGQPLPRIPMCGA